MLDLTGLAVRNTLRNMRRSILTVISIAIGCASLLGFAGFIEFSFYGLRESTIRNEIGHMQIYRKGYFANRMSAPESVQIDSPNEIIKALAGIRGITTAKGRLNFNGLGSTGNATQSVQVIGVNPAREIEFGVFERLIDGRHLVPGDKNSAVLGSDLMIGLNAKLGDWLTILTPTLDGVFNAVDVEIIGSVSTPSKAYNTVFVKVPVEAAQQALDTETVERIMILLENTEDLPQIRKMVISKLSELEDEFVIRTWDEIAEFYQSVVNLYTGQYRVFSIIIGIVVIFSVLNTMTMAVLERTPEISALRAIGARRQDVLNLILLEGTVIGLLGGFAGILLSFVLAGTVYLMGGIQMPPPPGASEGYDAYLFITFNDCVIAYLLCVAAAFFPSLFPAIRAQNLKVSEGLRA